MSVMQVIRFNSFISRYLGIAELKRYHLKSFSDFLAHLSLMHHVYPYFVVAL